MIFTDVIAALQETEYLADRTGREHYLVGLEDSRYFVTTVKPVGGYLEKIKPKDDAL